MVAPAIPLPTGHAGLAAAAGMMWLDAHVSRRPGGVSVAATRAIRRALQACAVHVPPPRRVHPGSATGRPFI
jgi:hypothetical protein